MELKLHHSSSTERAEKYIKKKCFKKKKNRQGVVVVVGGVLRQCLHVGTPVTPVRAAPTHKQRCLGCRLLFWPDVLGKTLKR